MRKFFNSVESQKAEREKNKLRMKLKRRVARIKLEAKLAKDPVVQAQLAEKSILSNVSEHQVSKIEFPEDFFVEHDLEAMIENLKKGGHLK